MKRREHWQAKNPADLVSIITIAAKLHHGYELTREEAVRAGNLLMLFTHAQDMRALLFKKVNHAPRSARHLWIALHFRILKLRGKSAVAALEVMKAWSLRDVKSVARIEREQRKACDEVLKGANTNGLRMLLKQIEGQAD